MTLDTDLLSPELITPMEMHVNGGIVTEEDMLNGIDDVLENLYDTGNLDAADDTIKTLLGMQKLSGMGLAKLLWGVKRWWRETGQDDIRGDTFDDYVIATHGFKSAVVVERYILVWDSYERNLLPVSFQFRPIKDQIAIAQTLDQGYEIPKKAMKRLEYASNSYEVGAILREVKGKQPKKGSMQLYMERDGELCAWVDDERFMLGWLNIRERDVPSIHKALQRILKGAGILER